LRFVDVGHHLTGMDERVDAFHFTAVVFGDPLNNQNNLLPDKGIGINDCLRLAFIEREWMSGYRTGDSPDDGRTHAVEQARQSVPPGAARRKTGSTLWRPTLKRSTFSNSTSLKVCD
jgi:hypothetical protein